METWLITIKYFSFAPSVLLQHVWFECATWQEEREWLGNKEMYGDQIYKGTAEVRAMREWWRGGVYCWGCVKTDGYAQPIWPLSSYSWPSWLRREKSFCWCMSDKVGLRLYLISIISELRQSGIFKCWDVGHSVTGTVESVMWMWNSVFAYFLHLWGFFFTFRQNSLETVHQRHQHLH